MVDLRLGPAIAKRTVYFEGWCIDALAAHLDQEAEIRRWTTPRLKTGSWRGPDGIIYVPLHGKALVTPREHDVLRWCDGRRTMHEIAVALAASGSSFVRDERDLAAILDELVRRKLVTWRLEVASQRHPERELEAHLLRIGDEDTRARCLDHLRRLDGARAAVASAAGDPGALAQRLTDLETTFATITGQAPSRHAGKTYGARGLVYEDCRRGDQLTLGAGVLDRIGPALSIVLDGARWLAGEVASAGRRFLRARLAELSTRPGEPIDGSRFFGFMGSAGEVPLDTLAAAVVPRYQGAWAAILDIGGRELAGPCVTRQSADIARRAAAWFGRPVPPWSRARFISPDLMIAADGIEAFQRGEFRAVLGEVHGTNSLLWSAFLSQHPDPQQLVAALVHDTRGDTVVVTQIPKAEWLARINGLVLPWFCRVEHGDDLPSVPSCRSVPVAMLLAVDNGQSVVMRARDGSLEFDALELFGQPLCERLHELIAQRLPTISHAPRVTIDDLIVARETWHTAAAGMSFLEEPDRARRFAAVRRWARAHRMPRCVFFKSPAEPKPCYLDFASRLYVDIFVRMMKRVDGDTPVRLVEMVPDVHGTWLTDADGHRYTCELRIAGRYHPEGTHV